MFLLRLQGLQLSLKHQFIHLVMVFREVSCYLGLRVLILSLGWINVWLLILVSLARLLPVRPCFV